MPLAAVVVGNGGIIQEPEVANLLCFGVRDHGTCSSELAVGVIAWAIRAGGSTKAVMVGGQSRAVQLKGWHDGEWAVDPFTRTIIPRARRERQ